MLAPSAGLPGRIRGIRQASRGSQHTACYPAYRLYSQLADKLAEDMDMVIDILPGVLDRDSPLVIEARREKDTAIRQEEPVGVGETYVDVPPGAIVVRALVAEHGTAFRADLRHMHGHAELVDDADIGLRQLPGKVDGMVMRVLRENLRERHQPGAHGHRVAVKGAKMQHFLVVDMAHDLLTPAKGADGHATADGFGEADQIRFDRVEFCDAAGGNGDARLHLIEDE